jgi:hypothetical protein
MKKNPIKKERNPKTGNVKVTYDDGSVEIIKASANPTIATKGTPIKSSAKKSGIAEKFAMENMTPKDVTLPVPQGSDLSQFDPNKVVLEDKTGYDPKTGMFKSTVTDTQTYGLPKDGTQSKYGLGDAIGMGAATLQAGYGLSQLMKDKRPIDKLDTAYNQLTNEAIAASKYGYSPAQKALLEQQITQGRIGQQAQINQLAGGNAAVGLTNSRVAINKEMMNKLQLASEDERIRMQKAQVAGQMAGNRAGMSRQLFADNMNAFQQKQQAGAELLGMGLSNVVGAARYAQEKQAQNQINKLMFGSGNIG